MKGSPFAIGRYGIVIDSRYHDSLAKQQLGKSGVVLSNLPPNPDKTEQLVRIQMPTEFAQGWVVTMGEPKRVPGFDPTGIGRTTAELFWGTAGVLNRAEIDWAQGSIIRLYGSTVIVNVISRLPDSGLVLDRRTAFQASATPGEHGTNNTIFLTQDITQFGQLTGVIESGGNLARIPVPAFARRVSIAFAVVGDRDIQLRWLGTGSTQIFAFDGTSFKSRDPSLADTGIDLPVPGHAETIEIRNTTPGVTSPMTATKIIWTIGL